MVITEGIATNDDVTLVWEHRSAAGLAEGVVSPDRLLLINGLGSPMVAYDPKFVAEFQQRGFDVARMDNRDAGKSTSTDGAWRLEDMADDAVAVLDELGWETAHVFGMSMGGMIVQHLAGRHPDRLDSFTSVMSTTGHKEFGQATPEARELLMTPSPTDREGWIAQSLKGEAVWGSPNKWTPEQSQARAATLFDYGVQTRGVLHQYVAIMNSGNRESWLAEVQVPALVLHGTEDTLITIDGGERTAEVLPNAQFIALDGMGHDLPPSYWTPIADHVRGFVDQL